MRYAIALCCLFATTALSTAQDPPAKPETPPQVLHEDFSKVPEKPGYTLRKHAEGKAPAVRDGKLHLLSGGGGENNSAAWPVQIPGERRSISAEMVFRLTPGARGLSFMLLHTGHFAAEGAAFYLYKQRGFPGDPTPAEPLWDEPNLWGSFAVALDTHNPPTEDPFNQWGNIHDRPQREVSLHWDGRELANVFCTPEFATGEACVLSVKLDFVTGGAEVTVGVGGQSVYDRHFLPHLMPYESRAAVGAYGPDGGACSIDSLHVDFGAAAANSPGPITVEAMRSAWHATRGPAVEREVELLPAGVEFERVLMTLRLKPMVERDEWDRLGQVLVRDGEESFELARILTPFMLWGVSYEYVCDVTHLRHLLTGKRTIFASMGSNVGKGFTFDIEFHYYRKPADVAALPKVAGVVNVWRGTANFNSAESVKAVYGVRRIKVPGNARSARLRICVTGHGVLEFKPLDRTVRVGDVLHINKLHTTDCYLNPWRPQFGTWKYDRAGWGPGSFGRVWEIDITKQLKPGSELELEYVSEDFESKDWASHVVESVVVFYE